MQKRYDYVLEFQYMSYLEDGYQGWNHAHYGPQEESAIRNYELAKADPDQVNVRLYRIELEPGQLWAETEEFRTIAEMLEEV